MKYIILILIALLLVDAFLIEPNFVATTKLDINSPKIPLELTGFKIVQISDLHIKGNGLRESQTISAIQSISPDLLVISGDFCEKKEELPEVKIFLDHLRQKFSGQIIATLGNWDFWMGDMDALVELLKQYDIQVLRNENIYIERGQDFINLVGVDDPYTEHDNLEDATARVNFDKFTVLVAHAPDIVNHVKDMQFDLILTGHTHGGQIFLPIISSKITPTNTKYIRGMYDTEFGKLYVNRGIGTSVTPIRLFSLPEITVFTLKNE